MADTSGCLRQLAELKLSDSTCPTRGSEELEYLSTVSAIEADDPASITALPLSCKRKERMKETGKSGEGSSNSRRVEEQIERSKAHCSTLVDECGAIDGGGESECVRAPASDTVQATTSATLPFVSAVEEQIERSKVHWSVLADHQSSGEDGEEVAEVSNVEEFKALQMHPVWGVFFQTIGYDLDGGRYRSMGELVMGKKLAEGAQGEIYEAQVKWWKSEINKTDLKNGRKYVLIVFKKGTFFEGFEIPIASRIVAVPCGKLDVSFTCAISKI